MKREDAVKLVETGFDELARSLEAGKSDRLIEWMAVTSRFYNYSFRNCMLIARQFPQATYVAGYRAWPKFGRHVKKGEKGIAILAPLVYKQKADDAADERRESDNETSECAVRGFKVAHVFDISQTEGDDLPQLHQVNGDPGPWVERLEQVIADASITVEESDGMGGSLGRSEGGVIRVATGLTSAVRFRVLAHELAHEELHKGDRRKETTKTSRETEAEAVACVVGRAIGLDSGDAAKDYIQLYRGDTKLLMESLDYIQKTARSIIERLFAEVDHTQLVA
jgi:antirestriction protein ArdC